MNKRDYIQFKDLGVLPEFSATGQGLGGADLNIGFKDVVLSRKRKRKIKRVKK